MPRCRSRSACFIASIFIRVVASIAAQALIPAACWAESATPSWLCSRSARAAVVMPASSRAASAPRRCWSPTSCVAASSISVPLFAAFMIRANSASIAAQAIGSMPWATSAPIVLITRSPCLANDLSALAISTGVPLPSWIACSAWSMCGPSPRIFR